ncbi:MAG: cobyrinate a,c-diamide synthase [Nitrospirae bacterium]|nr:cobyrinate a,c-diamide synthase [Nitrospirota bacterium]
MNKLKLPRLTISAPHRSSGKSTITIGLCAAFTEMGLKVQPFKKGPDFIDPMWHEAATGRQSHNLDFYMLGEDIIRQSFQRHASDADISIIEGNMGLYDGLDMAGSDSTAGLARLLKSPVVLVVDCSGMTRGIAPLVKGFESFEPETGVRAVILNKVKGARHERKLRDAIERYCDAVVVGALPHEDEMGIAMRHLGLVPVREDRGLSPVVEAMRKVIKDGVDLDRVLDMARGAEPLDPVVVPDMTINPPVVRIGMAMDSAFTFYYPENLEALRAAGAELVPFSPMSDSKLPVVDALYIGGGFPEVHMEALEKNESMRADIKRRIEDGMPVYAECGGLMYLCRAISWEGRTCGMVGALPCGIKMSKRPAGHGYVKLKATGAGNWPAFGDTIKAHEFHHSSVVELENGTFAFEMLRGKGVDAEHDGLTYKNVLAAYAHIHSLGTPDWAPVFVSFIRKACYSYKPG